MKRLLILSYFILTVNFGFAADKNIDQAKPLISNACILFKYINTMEAFPFFWDDLFSTCQSLFENKKIQDIKHPNGQLFLSNFIMALPNEPMKIALFTKFLSLCDEANSPIEGFNIVDPNTGSIFVGLAKIKGQEDLFFKCLTHCNKIMGKKRDHFSKRSDLKYLYNNKELFPTNVEHLLGGLFLE